ncbi:MAG: VOC family protein [Rhodococcus sp. (in: high G+C Gram-positive bacteria)]|jgi:catechol-2,3-dioxygenase|uniref:VOC family protein n=1 Tax=Nocardiaceae TaxID=85025 RepID=UPI00095E9E87|nr:MULTISPECIES: VOC family protein [Rhodococcus]MCC8927992.1 VOC family protein [Rhodococcus sp. I2R]MCZ4275741.1 VOC family protein [Rhodococcus yunnanensis]OLT36644.1 glyoxalase [Rhodococcus sp. CUA-806]
MPIQRLNHAVLYVRNVEKSVAFYTEVLGFRTKMRMGNSAAFLQASASSNDHDLGLMQLGDGAGASEAGRRTVGLYHLAWEVQSLTDLADAGRKLSIAGALVGASDHGTTKSLYAKDPDGLEFEIVWLVPLHLLDDAAIEASKTIAPLDLEAEIERYGADTLSGIGVSSSVSP